MYIMAFVSPISEVKLLESSATASEQQHQNIHINQYLNKNEVHIHHRPPPRHRHHHHCRHAVVYQELGQDSLSSL